MTLSTDALHVVLTRGDTPQMVTEYLPADPVLIINTGSDRVYLGSSSNLVPNTAVPCEAGASVTWRQPGQLWAQLDPAATSSTATVVLSECIASWEQSPVAVAIQVAQQIQASQLASLIGQAVPQAGAIGTQVAQQANSLGIPPTFAGALLLNQAPMGTVGQPVITAYTVPQDLSQYAGLTVQISGLVSQQLLTFAWYDALGNQILKRSYQATAQGVMGAQGFFTGSNISLTMPVEGPKLAIFVTKGFGQYLAPAKISLYASNRLHTASLAAADTAIDFTVNKAWTTTAPVYLGDICTPGGSHWGRFAVTTGGAGFFGYAFDDGAGNIKNNYVYHASASGDFYLNFNLPPGDVGLYFLPALAATYTVEWSITPPPG